MQGDKERLEEHIDRLSDSMRKLHETHDRDVEIAYRRGYEAGYAVGMKDGYSDALDECDDS